LKNYLTSWNFTKL